MNKKFLYLTSFTLILGSAVFTSCGSDDANDKNKASNTIDTTAQDSVADMDQIESVEEDFMLPSPMQVAQIFENAGMSYNSKWTNDPENVDQYIGESKKQFVFGVYSADLAYNVMNNKVTESKEYMKVIKTLADKTGLNAIFDGSELMTQFESSIGNKDEMIDVMIQIQEATDDFLQSNDKKHLGVIHFSGAWIEGVSIGAKDAIENGNNKLGMELSQQMVILENLIKGLKSQPRADEFTSSILADFQKLFNSFEGLESVKAYDETTQELNLTEAELKIISEQIIEIREKIVKV